MSQGPFRILLVDDNHGDVFLTVEAFKGAEVPCEICVAQDGVEALEILRREGRHNQAPRPDLILLDLNLPRRDGREVLAEIKPDPDLRRIPVVVLTSSSADSDMLQAYDLHANCYVVKPVDFKSLRETVRALLDFWTKTVRLPSHS